MSNDVFVAFWSGVLCGMVLGVFIFSVIIAIKTGELKRTPHKIFEEEAQPDARQIFGGFCPYTAKKCETWACGTCPIERRERQYLESEDGQT